MLRLFGLARSRASRWLWLLEELGLSYEHVPIRPGADSRSAEYLSINPNGRVPALDDDGFVLFESLAINLYLAERYGSAPLWPSEARERGLVYQWSFWAANEVEARLVNIVRRLSTGASERDGELASELEQLSRSLGVLDARLERAAHLSGSSFTLAGLNLAATLREPGEVGVASLPAVELAPFPHVERWLDRCAERPANLRVAAIAAAAP